MSDSKQHLIKLLPNKKAFFCKADQRVLDAALAAGFALPHSCRGGNCGRCVANVSGSYRYDRTTPPPGLTSEQRLAGKALLCQIVPETPLTVEVARADEAGAGSFPVLKLPCRITTRELVAPDVMKLVLQLPRTQPLDFKPGQYLDVLLDRGARRSYSLASLPYSISTDSQGAAAAHLELHVRRVEGGLFSQIAFDVDSGSSLLRVEGPHGAFGFKPTDLPSGQGPSLFIAGGTGYAPVKAMLLQAIAKNAEQPIHLFWGGRDREDLYEHSELLKWQEQYVWFTYTPVVETVSTEHGFETGRVPSVAFAQYKNLQEAMVYASGPPGLVSRVLEECKQRGVEESRVVTDSFDHAQ